MVKKKDADDKEWKTSKTRRKQILSLGVTKAKAFEWSNTRKGYWRVASSPILHRTLNGNYWPLVRIEVVRSTLDFHDPPPYTDPYVR
jgi:hypothetical protein